MKITWISVILVLVDDVARTEFDWKIYHLVEEDIDEMFNQYKTHIG